MYMKMSLVTSADA